MNDDRKAMINLKVPEWAGFDSRLEINDQVCVYFLSNRFPGGWEWYYPLFCRIGDDEDRPMHDFPESRMRMQKEGRYFASQPESYWINPETGELILEFYREQDHPMPGYRQRTIFTPPQYLQTILESTVGDFVNGTGDALLLSPIPPQFQKAVPAKINR
jgi:hypothetical protein